MTLETNGELGERVLISAMDIADQRRRPTMADELFAEAMIDGQTSSFSRKDILIAPFALIAAGGCAIFGFLGGKFLDRVLGPSKKELDNLREGTDTVST